MAESEPASTETWQTYTVTTTTVPEFFAGEAKITPSNYLEKWATELGVGSGKAVEAADDEKPIPVVMGPCPCSLCVESSVVLDAPSLPKPAVVEQKHLQKVVNGLCAGCSDPTSIDSPSHWQTCHCCDHKVCHVYWGGGSYSRCPGCVDHNCLGLIPPQAKARGMGKSPLPGWEVRGLKVEVKAPSSDWTLYWDIDLSVDLCTAMADFYLLQYMTMNHLGGKENIQGLQSEQLERLTQEAKGILDKLVERLDPIFCQYMDMAIGGELRHHRAIRSEMRFGSSQREAAWGGWKQVRDQVGPQALLDAAILAEEVTEGGYLGKAWAAPARILHARLTGRIPPVIFVDRAFSLEHNGGSLFNKVEWGVSNRMNWGNSWIKEMLGPAHSATRTIWGPLLLVASPETQRLLGETMRAANKVRVAADLRPVRPPSELDDLVVFDYLHYEGIARIFEPTSWLIERLLALSPLFEPETIEAEAPPGFAPDCRCSSCYKFQTGTEFQTAILRRMDTYSAAVSQMTDSSYKRLAQVRSESVRQAVRRGSWIHAASSSSLPPHPGGAGIYETFIWQEEEKRWVLKAQ